MILLSFDPGISMGWALIEDGKVKDSGYFFCGVPDLPISARLFKLQELLQQTMEKFKPDVVIVEAVNRVGSKKGTKETFNKNSFVLPATYAMVLIEAYKRSIKIVTLSPSTVTARFLDDEEKNSIKELKSSDKAIKKKTFTRKTGVKNHNEADAIALGLVAYELREFDFDPKKAKEKEKNVKDSIQ